jgi:hypothetical protein
MFISEVFTVGKPGICNELHRHINITWNNRIKGFVYYEILIVLNFIPLPNIPKQLLIFDGLNNTFILIQNYSNKQNFFSLLNG